LAVLENAGDRPEHIHLITAFCIDKPTYLEVRSKLGKNWRHLMVMHYKAMSTIFVYDLMTYPVKN